VLDQQLGLRGELDPPAGLAQQRDADLLLQLGQLLRDRRRALVQRRRDFRNGSAHAQLAEQPQPPDVVHGHSRNHKQT
jgi:hypothetical protein